MSLSPDVCLNPRKIAPSSLRVFVLEFDPDESPAEPDRLVPFRSDPSKRGENRLAGITPEPHTSLNRPKLQRTDMTIIVVRARLADIERVGFADTVPDRPCPFDPVLVRDVRMDRFGVIAGLAEHEDIVG